MMRRLWMIYRGKSSCSDMSRLSSMIRNPSSTVSYKTVLVRQAISRLWLSLPLSLPHAFKALMSYLSLLQIDRLISLMPTRSQPPNTAVPPLTPSSGNFSVQLADSPNQSNPSPEQYRGSPTSAASAHSRKPSIDQLFYTPAATPKQPTFSRSKSNIDLSQHMLPSSPSSEPKTPAEQNTENGGDESPGYAVNATPKLRPSQSALGLFTFNEETDCDPLQSDYFAKRSANRSTGDLPKKMPPCPTGNAFAQRHSLYTKQLAPIRTQPPLPDRKSSLKPAISQPKIPRDRQKKRTSFRSNEPLPLHTTSSATSVNSSSRSSLRMRDSTCTALGSPTRVITSSSLSSNQDSALSQWSGPASPTESVPMLSTSMLMSPTPSSHPQLSPTIPPGLDRTLKRPSSIQVKKDLAPFLATSRRDSPRNTAATRPSLADRSSTVPALTPRKSSKVQNSVLVPVVRPPVRAGKRVSGIPRVGSPPSKPPDAPLPPTPPTSQMSPPVAAAIITH